MDDATLARLEAAEMHYHELQEVLSDPQVAANPELLRKYAQELAQWEDLVHHYRSYLSLTEELETLKEMAREETNERNWIDQEIANTRRTRDQVEQEIQHLLMPSDPNDGRNVIMEIRAGAGGEEAALFAAELFRLYARYAERHGWKTELLSVNGTNIGGYKEIVFMIEGAGAYSHLKFERGVHRVQRVPVTEAGGRIHTSTVTVAVLPEVEEVEVTIDPDDLRIDTMRSSGAGGQHVNKTESAVRITHIPTGIVVSCQDEKSQLKNRDKAMKVLRARLKNLYDSNQAKEIADDRRQQVGTGDRSEKIRTYNFPQGRVTDHRVGITVHQLEAVLDGDIEDIIAALQVQEQEERLQQES